MKAHAANVTGTTRLTEEMIRVHFSSEAIKGKELPFTDHYVKLLFVPEDADYAWPFDLAKLRLGVESKFMPIKRTYTLRNVDTDKGTFDIDFVYHGDNGLAGVWANRAQAGDVIPYVGPGGAWAPSSATSHYMLVGDESAAPAILEAVAALPDGATADVYLEVSNNEMILPVDQKEGVTFKWVLRDGAVHGTRLCEAIRSNPAPSAQWFVHGVAEMIKDLRKFLFVENSVAKEDVSISGYWRLGMTEDQWQASKREFVEQLAAEEEELKNN